MVGIKSHRTRCLDRSPDILVDTNGLVGSPHEAAGEESEQEEKAVVELRARAGHVDFVKEPMKVEERGGELVEDECGAVEVDERSL